MEESKVLDLDITKEIENGDMSMLEELYVGAREHCRIK